EGKRISTIERLGQTRSPLNVDELIQGLADPSFNVRFEAVVSIARTRSDPKLTEALVNVLRSGEPDMRIAAAWALGRVGDRRAIEPLRDAIDSDYPLLRARSARALGTLGDKASANTLLERFGQEPDSGIKLAYASALGTMQCTEALDAMLQLLDTLEDRLQRGELALALAALCGRDDWFVKLARRVESDPGDTMGGVLLSMRKRLLRSTGEKSKLGDLIDQSVRAFGDEKMPQAIECLRKIVGIVPNDQFLPPAAKVLGHARQRLAQYGAARLDLVMLCLHILHTGFGATATQSDTTSNDTTIEEHGSGS
ncbi:MAG: HEAT repeat domain-containing protein, partial [Pirellulaceae bacterium]|nr:HEAT repeat domain-containing protein [Pirellulaceae bacterium]